MKYTEEQLLSKGYKNDPYFSFMFFKRFGKNYIAITIDGTYMARVKCLNELDVHMTCIYGPSEKIYSGKEYKETWVVNGKDVTDELSVWLKDNGIKRPLSKTNQILLKLRFD